MASKDILEWLTTISGWGAAIASAGAAFFARQAAIAARTQIELQRPRPVVFARFEHTLRDLHQLPMDEAIQLLNLGNAIAFDVQIEEMAVPKVSVAESQVTRLQTKTIPYLQPGEKTFGEHSIEPGGGVLSTLKPATDFVRKLSKALNEYAKNPNLQTSDHQYPIKCFISYRAADGRQFRQPYRLVINFPRQIARLELVGSLLEVEKS